MTLASEATVLDQWSDEHAKLDHVVKALTDLRHRSARSATRTAVMTLVIVATTTAEADVARDTMHALRGHHPARIVLLEPQPEAEPGVGATATLYAGEDDSDLVFEEVDLVVRGPGAAHLDTIVDPFTLADLPIVVWYPGAIPRSTDPLLNVCTTVLIDTREAGFEDSVPNLRELARRRTVVDLSWTRLRPWREVLAGMFDDPGCRPYLDGVASVEVSGKPGPRAMLGGWLVAQLGLAPSRLTLRDARHVQMKLEATKGDVQGVFEVNRSDTARLVWASATLSSGPSNRQVLPLPEDSLAWSLGQALTHLEPDKVWERALAAAAKLTGTS